MALISSHSRLIFSHYLKIYAVKKTKYLSQLLLLTFFLVFYSSILSPLFLSQKPLSHFLKNGSLSLINLCFLKNGYFSLLFHTLVVVIAASTDLLSVPPLAAVKTMFCCRSSHQTPRLIWVLF